MRIRIDKVYTTYYDSSLNKYVVIARVYINGQLQHRRLFFAERQKMTEAAEGGWINY